MSPLHTHTHIYIYIDTTFPLVRPKTTADKLFMKKAFLQLLALLGLLLGLLPLLVPLDVLDLLDVLLALRLPPLLNALKRFCPQ